MSQEAREWLGLVAVVVAGMSFASLLIWIQAADRGRARARTAKTLGLLWGAVLVSVAGGWLLYVCLGGPLFEVQTSGGLGLMVRSLTAAQVALLCGALALLMALYVTAILSVRGLLGAQSPPALELGAQPDTESEEQ
jgi:hypothetical protein